MLPERKRIDEAPEILDVVQRLCELVERVSHAHDYESATDCFCTRGGMWRDGTIQSHYWRHDPETSIAFIERATQSALDRKALADYLRGIRRALGHVVRAIRRNPFA